MPIDDRDPAPDTPSLRAVIDEALATRSPEERADLEERADPGWLGVGIWLGLNRPREAGRMLELIETGSADRLVAGEVRIPTVDRDAARAGGRSEAADSTPVSSMLLVRSASMPESETDDDRQASRFGWAARLTRAEILSAGSVVADMIARGAPADIGRGFGIAWDAGVRVPREERDGLLGLFVELETTVAEVLTGRDLRRTAPAPPSSGLAGLLGAWLTRPNPGDAAVAAAIEQGGEPARLGLIALWNAWAASRFRVLIPRPTYEQLVEPWVTVVGPLPET